MGPEYAHLSFKILAPSFLEEKSPKIIQSTTNPFAPILNILMHVAEDLPYCSDMFEAKIWLHLTYQTTRGQLKLVFEPPSPMDTNMTHSRF